MSEGSSEISQPAEVVRPPTKLERVIERRHFEQSQEKVLAFIRDNVNTPELILTPTNSEIKIKFLLAFMQELFPDRQISVMGIKVASGVREQPFGLETKLGAQTRMKNALDMALQVKRGETTTGNPELDELIRTKEFGCVGSIENGMVEGEITPDGVTLDYEQDKFNPDKEHFDIAYANLIFSKKIAQLQQIEDKNTRIQKLQEMIEEDSIVKASPPDEAVRFDPRDAVASAGKDYDDFSVTAGNKMKERYDKAGIKLDNQNWHGEVIKQEIQKAKELREQGLEPVGLHTEEFDGFDRFEQLTGPLFDAFYELAQQNAAAKQTQQT